MKLYHYIMRAIHWTPDKKSPSYIYHNNKFKGLLAIIAIVLFLLSKPITADFLSEEDKTVNVAESLMQSTVIIAVNGGGGSGFFISAHEIITNHHVINDAKSVFIKKSNGTQCFASVVFAQSDPDLALLKTDCEGKPIPLTESVKAGQSVLAIGDPMGQEFYVSKGIVGLVKDKEILHDAMIEKGMSGGGLVNLNGQLVGVNQAYLKDAPRIGSAISISALSYFLYQAKEMEDEK